MTSNGSKLGILAVTMVTLGSGCANASGEAYMRDRARLAAEGNRVWSRPTEVGYDIIEGEVEGTATAGTILWFIDFGASGGGGFLDGVTGAIRGIPVDDTATLTAADDAVTKSPGADGLYITRRTETRFNIGGLYSTRTVTVRGKPTKLKVIGQVPMERADKERFLRALSGTTVNVPPELVDRLLGSPAASAPLSAPPAAASP